MRLAILLTLLFSVPLAHADKPGAPTAHSGQSASPPGGNAMGSQSGVVNLMTASEEELMRLPGIGPSKAHAIVELRKTHPFKKTDDIVRVKGIGRKTFQRLKPYLSVSGPTTLLKDVRPVGESAAKPGTPSK